MIRERVQIAVLGSGFAGSLMAMVFRRIGLDVVLIERGSHPRFAMGESSTPLANLSLENIARTYDLPGLLPLTEYGQWRSSYPNLTCGLKRGFSFFSHESGEHFKPTQDHARELLVAASPNSASADTHWLRSEFDEFLVFEARSIGVIYHDQTEVGQIDRSTPWIIRGQRLGEPVETTADFLIDASGPGGVLSTHLPILSNAEGLQTTSHAVYSHWNGVAPWSSILDRSIADMTEYPFPCDAAALHHITPEGWMWVLRFDSGVTSAGFASRGDVAPADAAVSAEQRWQRILQKFPSIKQQFASAVPIRPLVATSRMQRCSERFAGPGWAMLPHAGYFLDPLLSPGIAHSLLGIERLGRLFRDTPSPADLESQLAKYEQSLQLEVQFVDGLLDGAYQCLGRPDFLHAWLMYYFAAAIHCESRRRQAGQLDADVGFLNSDDETFRERVYAAKARLSPLRDPSMSPEPRPLAFSNQVARDIQRINHAGLCDPEKRNMYPFV